jgi:peptidoglycan/xylan/chitin deacetylase (PgdA/CDA1 family)
MFPAPIKVSFFAMYFVKTPRLLQLLLPHFEWRIPTKERIIYLTFDDGPIPDVTPWVLETLAKYDARATFFCVGDNVRKHPDVFQQVLKGGHSVGNHTFNHLNGWKTEDGIYLDNVAQCAQYVTGNLFRPPYGRVRGQQRKALNNASYRIIMWDVLSGDFDRSISPEQCRDRVLKHAGPGSIVVLHDSLKSEPNLRVTLPAVLEYFSGKGYRFLNIK